MSAPPSPPPPPPSGPPSWDPPVGAQPPVPVATTSPRTSGTAIWALVVAIGSFVVCPVVAAVVALVLAHVAGNQIDASDGRVGGTGLVTAAKIVAWIHLVLVAIAVLAIDIVLIATG